MQFPRISIVTPSFNQAKFLGRAMDSVCAYLNSDDLHLHSSNEFELCTTELKRLRDSNLPFPLNSVRAKLVRGMTTLQRTLWCAVQGEFLWLLGRIPDRISAR